MRTRVPVRSGNAKPSRSRCQRSAPPTVPAASRDSIDAGSSVPARCGVGSPAGAVLGGGSARGASLSTVYGPPSAIGEPPFGPQGCIAGSDTSGIGRGCGPVTGCASRPGASSSVSGTSTTGAGTSTSMWTCACRSGGSEPVASAMFAGSTFDATWAGSNVVVLEGGASSEAQAASARGARTASTMRLVFFRADWSAGIVDPQARRAALKLEWAGWSLLLTDRRLTAWDRRIPPMREASDRGAPRVNQGRYSRGGPLSSRSSRILGEKA